MTACTKGDDAPCTEALGEGACCGALEYINVDEDVVDPDTLAALKELWGDDLIGYGCVAKAAVDAIVAATDEGFLEVKYEALGYSTKSYCAGAVARATVAISAVAALALATA